MQSLKNCLRLRCAWMFAFALALQLLFPGKSFGTTVTDLTATYSNGQVFLTWTNASFTNQQYNIYRSGTPLTSSSQLNASTFLGFVRDSSSKNYRLSTLDKKNIFFRIKTGGQPLAANQGLYAVTCTDNKSYYYAVTITDLSSGIESKKLTTGKNSLATAVSEKAVQPLPVLQDSIVVKQSEVKYRYVQFVNNQETPLYPAMNSTGSFYLNIYLQKIGTAKSYPLLVQYNGDALAANEDIGANSVFTYGYVLGVDDWLPVKQSDGVFGTDDYFIGYHEDFNIYTDGNPVPTSGIIKTYAQKSYLEAIDWVESHFPIDTTRVYTTGTSHTGFGALLTAAMYPEKIAAVYDVVEPVSVGPNGELLYEEEWGLGSTKLNTDFNDPNTGLPVVFNKLSDIKNMMHIDELLDLPLIFDVHGKNDTKVGWNSGKIDWFDSLESNEIGGAFYWDQRDHAGDGKNFDNDETTPVFYRYQTTKSYPAFSYCSIDQDPGNGSKNSGAPYGGFNSYLDFNDSIIDQSCSYSVNVFIKNLYVGGVLDPKQYDTCTANVTFRRLQHFHPASGKTVTWANYDITKKKIQSGSFVYNGGLISLNGIRINKTGNTLSLGISGCTGPDEQERVADPADSHVFFYRDENGYTANIQSAIDEVATLSIYDVTGRIISADKIAIAAGTTVYRLPKLSGGMYLVKIESSHLHYSDRLLF